MKKDFAGRNCSKVFVHKREFYWSEICYGSKVFLVYNGVIITTIINNSNGTHEHCIFERRSQGDDMLGIQVVEVM